MRILPFRLRSQDRDRETDENRFRRLAQLIARLREEIAEEHVGLERRYQDAEISAASAQADLENEGGKELDQRIGELTDALKQCASRLERLDRHTLFLEDVQKSIERFVGSEISRRQD